MHAGRHYSLREVFVWTRRETFVFLLLATVPTLLHIYLGWASLIIPWLPIALVGTAVAFITGFKNSASYSRLWEARQIWGAIVNDSRTWGLMVSNFVAPGNGAQRRLIYRHLAWLTALRYQLREPRSWENTTRRHNVEYRKFYRIVEWEGDLRAELEALLDPAEIEFLLKKKNTATQLIAIQSKEIRELTVEGSLGEFPRLEMQRTLFLLLDSQGKCERIKNFPYPRQFATLNLLFVWLFILMVPYGLLQEFEKIGAAFTWMTIPASVVVCWVFHTMDKIGDASENPFEGSPNDVPITSLSRVIEIDLREMLGEREIPAPIQPVNNILM